MATLKYGANSSLQIVTLGAAYVAASGAMTLTAGHGARLPTGGDFWLAYKVSSTSYRFFKVTARATDGLTVVADATEGSGDANIASGETLYWALTVAALTQLRADICSYGAYANLPATCAIGDSYYTSDSPYTFVATAVNTWTAFLDGRKVTLPPSTGWTWANQNASTANNTLGTLALRFPQANASGGSLYYRTPPSTPYTITMFRDQLSVPGSFHNSGLAFYESGTGKLITIGTINGGTLRLGKWASLLTISTNTDYTPGWPTDIKAFRLTFDATTITLQISMDIKAGQWQTILSEAKATFFTVEPNQVGFYFYKNNAILTHDYVSIYSWEAT